MSQSTPVSIVPYNGPELNNSSGNVAAASAVATLTPAAGSFAYLTKAYLSGGGATGASLVTATITGVAGGPLSFTVPVPAGVAVGLTADSRPIVLDFTGLPQGGLKGAAAGTAIVVTMPSLGAGNTNAAVTATGFQR